MSKLKEQFGKKLKRLRAEKELTQRELATKAGFSVDFLSLIERGQSAPSFKNIENLAEALEVKPVYFFKDLNS